MTIVASNSLTVSNVNDGTITHTAWSYSADGTDRFTTVYPNLNLLVNSSAKTKDGFFKNFDKVENDYGEVTIKGTNTWINKDLFDGFSIKPRDYKPGDTYTMSMDVMFTNWNLPAGTTIGEFWMGQRYTTSTDGSISPWKKICYIDLPRDPSNMLNQWIRITKTSTIPPYPDPSVNTESRFITRFIGASEGSFTIRVRNPKQELGSTATPWMPSSSEVTTADWPRYIGQYTDFTQADNTNPSNYVWSLMRGDDGIAGNDGVGINSTTITYAISTSGTTAPSTGWTSSVPGLVKGQYLWTKTVWTYTDNSSETGYSVTYISKDGNNGNDGIAGKDGVGIKATVITYASNTNGTTAPTTGYTTTVPSVPAGQFLWTKTVWTYTDNSSEIGYSVAMMGLKGDQGIKGTDGIAGRDGKGIKATAITYQASTNGTTAPTGTWSASVPTVAKGSFLWTRTIWTYTDNTTETGYAVAYMGTNGNNGTNGLAGKDGTGIKTTTITYAGSTSGTTAPSSGWTSTVPTVAAGSYLWTKTVWAYTDNTSETGYSVAKMGNNGATGPQGRPGSNGDPGKTVSNTEPISLFKGLTWKYSGTSNLTASDRTVILPGTEYYWSGTNWVLNEINSHNINGDNLSVTNGTFKDGKIESIWSGNGVNGTTTIEGSHLQIYSSNSTTNTENTVEIDNLQGYAQVHTDRNTGRAITVQASVQGFFVSDSTGPFVRVTPTGIVNSVDVSWTTIGSYAAYRRDGGVVTIRVVRAKTSATGNIYIGTIPLKDCPAVGVMGTAVALSASVAGDRHIQINGLNSQNSGSVTILSAVANEQYTFQFTYQI